MRQRLIALGFVLGEKVKKPPLDFSTWLVKQSVKRRIPKVPEQFAWLYKTLR